jgi:hypothetical protein
MLFLVEKFWREKFRRFDLRGRKIQYNTVLFKLIRRMSTSYSISLNTISLLLLRRISSKELSRVGHDHRIIFLTSCTKVRMMKMEGKSEISISWWKMNELRIHRAVSCLLHEDGLRTYTYEYTLP